MPGVLLVTMYGPPAAGAGAQRPANLLAHLPRLGIDVHLLTPDDPKWLQDDPAAPPAPAVTVHRVRNLGPRSRLRGREVGGERAGGRIASELALLPRRVLVPDPEIVWAATAARAAVRLVERNAIDVVVTTSPPLSVHLVGALTQRFARARWIADLRDPIVASPYRRAELRGESSIGRLVAHRADAVTAATRGAADELRRFGRHVGVTVAPNGCDIADFDGLEYRPGNRFRITHTGSFHSPYRSPRPFLDALQRANVDVVARFVGDFRPSDRRYADALGLGDRVESIPFLPRRRALALQRDSEALLLLIPEGNGRGRGVVTAKLCEYVAARRPILAAIPPDGEAADVLRTTGAAEIVAPNDVDAMAATIGSFHQRWQSGRLDVPSLPPAVEDSLSGRALAELMARVIGGVL